MEPSTAIQIAGLIVQVVMVIFLAGRWKGKQDTDDLHLDRRLNELDEQTEERFKRMERAQSIQSSTLRRLSIDLEVLKATIRNGRAS